MTKPKKANLQLITFALIALVLIGGCGGASYPERDISGVVLKMEDVPGHLTPASGEELAQMGLSDESFVRGLNLENATVQNTSVFMNTTNPEEVGVIMSAVIYPLTRTEVTKVDAEFLVNDVSDSNYVANMVRGMGSNITDLAGADSLGDKSLGVTFEPTGFPVEATGDMILVRQENALLLLVGLYATGSEVDAVQLAKTLTNRFEAAPTR